MSVPVREKESLETTKTILTLREDCSGNSVVPRLDRPPPSISQQPGNLQQYSFPVPQLSLQLSQNVSANFPTPFVIPPAQVHPPSNVVPNFPMPQQAHVPPPLTQHQFTPPFTQTIQQPFQFNVPPPTPYHQPPFTRSDGTLLQQHVSQPLSVGYYIPPNLSNMSSSRSFSNAPPPVVSNAAWNSSTVASFNTSYPQFHPNDTSSVRAVNFTSDMKGISRVENGSGRSSLKSQDVQLKKDKLTAEKTQGDDRHSQLPYHMFSEGSSFSRSRSLMNISEKTHKKEFERELDRRSRSKSERDLNRRSRSISTSSRASSYSHVSRDSGYSRSSYSSYSHRALPHTHHDRNRHLVKDDQDRHPSKEDRDRHPSKEDRDRHPSKEDRDRHPSKGGRDRQPLRDEGDGKPLRDDRDKQPPIDDRDKQPPKDSRVRHHPKDRHRVKDDRDRHHTRVDQERHLARGDKDKYNASDNKHHARERSSGKDVKDQHHTREDQNRHHASDSRVSKQRHRPRERHSSQKEPSMCKESRNEKQHVPVKSDQRKSTSERDMLLEKWRHDYCETAEEINEKLDQIATLSQAEIIELEKQVWTRTTPADLYYVRDENNHRIMNSTPKLKKLVQKFKDELVFRAQKIAESRPSYEPPPRKKRLKLAKHKSEVKSSSESSSDNSSDDEEHNTMEEMERKRLHPYRLHQELWFNDSGEMNDGPLCRCSAKSRKYGIRHGVYAGEEKLPRCNPYSNNASRLHHYRITISPPTNFLTKTPTIIKHDEHEFIFEGFSMFTHHPLRDLPTCKVIRFNIEYTILYIEEKLPENFTVEELDAFFEYLFKELLELVDLDFYTDKDRSYCPQFHFMPRFVRDLPDNGREILSMNEVLNYLLTNGGPLIKESRLSRTLAMPQFEWQNFADEIKGMVVTYPGMKPCSLRVDQLDRENCEKSEDGYPEIVHFGIRPPQLSYAGNPEYQKAWREYVKFRHLLANMPKPSFEEKHKLALKESALQEMRTQSKMKRDVTIAISAKGFHRTGIMCDVVQHAMLIPVLVCHLRFHKSCDILEDIMGYHFENRYLLQLALTHPSYRENFGTNPDHARNTLTNCGIRQPQYGDRRIHYMNTRKRGINTLINIMSRFGKSTETQSNICHNERLEFLGDAVVEFLTSVHLFLMFPELEEGGLATFRAALVQNQHLAVLAKNMQLDEFMLYAHGSDLCHDLELKHAMANCFEAVMGALFLDGGIEVPDRVFGNTLFLDKQDILSVWADLPKHPLQEQEPNGDRHWIERSPILKRLVEFEESIGVRFTHIRLLARAFTDRSIGYTNITLGSNQRLEFLGDTVLQLIASEYLYKHFPEHHEGHLSLLRSSLVNNRTQAVVCNDLDMSKYAMYSHPKADLKTKDRADLLEALLGAIYVDAGLTPCRIFCDVCFFPRLQMFIMNQDWNDPKSKLQQCCLTLRTLDGGEPDIPVYKVIECKGPTNTRVYTVAVYFRGSRLAKASGHSIQMAEMNAAKAALENSKELFPQLAHQKRVIAKSLKKNRRPNRIRKGSVPSKSSADVKS